MHTVTKKELVDRIVNRGGFERAVVRQIIQKCLDNMVTDLGRGNRLELRDFGIFECKDRAARMGHNPKTLERVPVPPTRTVKFKLGRLLKQAMEPGSA
jgi:integration host factor subunit beta